MKGCIFVMMLLVAIAFGEDNAEVEKRAVSFNQPNFGYVDSNNILTILNKLQTVCDTINGMATMMAQMFQAQTEHHNEEVGLINGLSTQMDNLESHLDGEFSAQTSALESYIDGEIDGVHSHLSYEAGMLHGHLSYEAGMLHGHLSYEAGMLHGHLASVEAAVDTLMVGVHDHLNLIEATFAAYEASWATHRDNWNAFRDDWDVHEALLQSMNVDANNFRTAFDAFEDYVEDALQHLHDDSNSAFEHLHEEQHEGFEHLHDDLDAGLLHLHEDLDAHAAQFAIRASETSDEHDHILECLDDLSDDILDVAHQLVHDNTDLLHLGDRIDAFLHYHNK